MDRDDFSLHKLPLRHAAWDRAAVLPDAARQFRLSLVRPLPPGASEISIPHGLANAIPRRQAQFRAGRYCAMKAMESLGGWCAGQHVGRSATGAPVWPQGVVGSITHTNDFASAAVALTSDAMAVGIDTERVMSESQARNVSRIVASPGEVAHACAAGMSRLEALTLVFSAKESIFKCLHPIVSCYFDFRDVQIVAIDGESHTFAARLIRTLSDDYPARTILEGRFDVEVPWIHTGLALPPGPIRRALV